LTVRLNIPGVNSKENNILPKSKIVFIVGHERWGKSETIRALTHGDYYQRKITISGIVFFVRRMSNDDKPEEYIRFVKSIDPSCKPCIIAALCPNFERRKARTRYVLETLQMKGYELFFWVIESQYKTSNVVTPQEIQRLRGFGKVEVYAKRTEAGVRSRSFRRFIKDALVKQPMSAGPY
jgi:hypothetical protein